MENQMSLDEMLGRMMDAMEADNYWDTEAYANMAMDYLESDSPISADSEFLDWDRDALIDLLVSTREVASKMYEANKSDSENTSFAIVAPPVEYTEAEKESLIDQIINFEG